VCVLFRLFVTRLDIAVLLNCEDVYISVFCIYMDCVHFVSTTRVFLERQWTIDADESVDSARSKFFGVGWTRSLMHSKLLILAEKNC